MNSCNVCQSDRIATAFRIDPYSLSRCGRCQHVYVSEGLAADSLDQAYGKEYYDGSAAQTGAGYDDYLRNADARTRGFEDRLRQIEQRVSGRGRLLDYGCAVGLFVKVAAEAGWDATGYERSAWAADYGRTTYGLNILTGDGTDPLPFKQKFDVVTMWDVLEHLEKPQDVIASMAHWLKPGGLLALNTVNISSVGARMAGARWRHLAPPHHLQYFSRESLTWLLKKHGFSILWAECKGVMLEADGSSQRRGGPINAIEQVATHWRTKRIATALNLLDEIEVIAIKRDQP